MRKKKTELEILAELEEERSEELTSEAKLRLLAVQVMKARLWSNGWPNPYRCDEFCSGSGGYTSATRWKDDELVNAVVELLRSGIIPTPSGRLSMPAGGSDLQDAPAVYRAMGAGSHRRGDHRFMSMPSRRG